MSQPAVSRVAIEPVEVPIAPELPMQLDRVKVPPQLLSEIDRLVERVAARTGEPPALCRRGVEIAVLTRGVAALREEYR